MRVARPHETPKVHGNIVLVVHVFSSKRFLLAQYDLYVPLIPNPYSLQNYFLIIVIKSLLNPGQVN